MTTAFARLFRSRMRSTVVLIRVFGRDPSTLNGTPVLLSTADLMTPSGSTEDVNGWVNALLNVSPIQAPGALGETSVSLCSMSFTVAIDKMPNLKTLLWVGGSVETWLWDTGCTTFDDALLVFKGVVLDYDMDAISITFSARQRTNWNRNITPVEVTTQAYPMAPEDSFGQSIPIVYGRLRDIPFRYPWAEYPQAEDVTSGTVIRGSPLIFGGRRAGAAIVVDAGRGSGAANNPAAKVLCASHKVSRIGDHKTGTGFFLDAGAERLVSLDVLTPGTDIINTATEAGILVRDDEAIAWASALPGGVATFTGSGENIRAVLDPWNDNNYCRLDWTAGLKFCHMHFPALPQELGVMTEIYIIVAYRSPANTNLTLRIYRDASPTAATDFALPVTATRKIRMFRVATAWGTGLSGNHIPVSPYAFSETNMEVGWPTFPSVITGTGTAELYCAGWLVRFIPGQSIILSDRVVSKTSTRPVRARGKGGAPGGTVFMPYTTEETLPAVTELRGKFYANVDGWPDDGLGSFAGETLSVSWGTAVSGQFTVSFADASQLMKDRLLRVSIGDLIVSATGGPNTGGTVTGYNPTTFVLTLSNANLSTGPVHGATLGIKLRNALLERAPDILAHMLVNYGGEPLANLEQGATTFGSLVAARAKLLNPQNRDMTYAFSVDKTTDLMTAITWLAQGSLSFVFLDRFTDKWHMCPWRTDAPLDYTRLFTPADLDGEGLVQVSGTPLSQLLTGLEVNYSYASNKKHTLFRNRLAWDGSDAGHKYRGLRDGFITVSAANNKLAWQLTGVGAFGATLSNGTYTPAAFAALVDAAMKAADATRDYIVVWGATIVVNYNDQLFFRDEATLLNRTVTFTPGTYTFESLAAHVASVIDAANGAFPVQATFSRSTRKMTFERFGSQLTILPSTGPLRARRFLATIGFIQTAATAATDSIGGCTSAFERDDEFFIVGNNTLAMNLNWEAGGNGINGTRTDCHALLGFEGIRDSVGIGLAVPATCLLADSPKVLLEGPLAVLATRHGARRDTVVDARSVQESETARELRNRVAALAGKGRVVLRFATEVAPDLERCRVIGFSSEFDAILPYPDPDTDGSWVAKRFVVVETAQGMGPLAFHTQVTAVSLD